MKSAILAGAVGLALVASPDPGSAQPKHCPPGHAMKGWCDMDRGDRFRDRDRDRDRDRYRDRDRRERLRFEDALDDAYEEGFREGRREERFRIGERLNRDRYRVLDRSLFRDRYGRRLDDRYYYAEVDGRRMLIEAATGAIVDLLMR